MIIALAVQLAGAMPTTLPRQFVGAWTEDLALCGKEDTNGVLIEPAAITFYEARGTVRTATSKSGQVVATVHYAGESRIWSETNMLRLAGNDSLMLTALGKTATLRRCPSANGN